MKPVVQLASLAVLLLGGCASGLPGLRPLTYATPGEAHVFATGERCAHEPAGQEAAGLVAAALTGAASQLLKNFGTALSEGAKGGALPASVATTNLELASGTVPRCLVVIRGAFQPSDASTTPIGLLGWLGLPPGGEAATRLASLGIPPVYRIDHYIEIKVMSSASSKALTFAPVHVRLVRSIDGAAKGERDVSVAVRLGRVGADATGSAVVVADRRIGAAGFTWTATEGRYLIEAPWFASFHASPSPSGTAAAGAAAPPAGPPVAAPPAGGVVGAGGAGAGGQLAGPPVAAPAGGIVSMRASGASAVPTTVTVTVVETRPTNQALAFVASVFGGLQPKVEERLKTAIDDDARRTAEVAEATGQLDLEANYATALGTAQAAVVTYCEAASADATAAGRTDRITKSQAARSAQIKANAAAIKADTPLPYPTLATISSDLARQANPATCPAG